MAELEGHDDCPDCRRHAAEEAAITPDERRAVAKRSVLACMMLGREPLEQHVRLPAIGDEAEDYVREASRG
jgi:hypothetical protein